MKTTLPRLLLVTGSLALALALPAGGHAQTRTGLSDASALSGLSPFIASLVVVGGSAVVGASAYEAVSGAVRGSAQLVVRAVNVSAEGVSYVLERAADGASAATQFSVNVAGKASVAVGQTVAVSTIATGVVISAAGQVIAYIPNALGQSLLRNERISP